MIIETMMLFGLTVTTLIFIIKFWNVVNKGEVFQKEAILLFLGIGVISWGLSFLSFLGSIGDQSTSQIIDGANTILVTQSNNSYVYLAIFMDVQNAMIGAILIFTCVEVIYLLKAKSVNRKEGFERN